MAETLLVIGGGTMGAGIAAVAATGGYDVELVEPQVDARERAAQYFEREEARCGVEGLAARIRWNAEIPSGSEATVAIEAVPERFEMKRQVFAALARALAPDALIATNTSSLSVDELADTVSNPQRVIGLHFFNPPARMRLVEVVRGAQSSPDAVERGLAIVHALGKTPVVTSDTPGFIVNRVARPFYLQSLRALCRGLATVEELDALARGAGFRMGPFELMDLIGLDVNLATTQSLYERTGSPRFAPVALQEEMIARGELGRKSGVGFYRYDEGVPSRFEPGVAPTSDSALAEENVAVVGLGDLAAEIGEAVGARYAHVQRVENDDMLPDLSAQTTILIDTGDGVADRSGVLERLDAAFGPETVLIADAYATDVSACARRLRHPERLLGFGILDSLHAQRIVEIVDLECTSDETLELAQEFFAVLGKASILVEDAPALFLGRTVGSIVNEAMIAVHDGVASPEDIDTAMRFGANYPLGPIAWGRAIRGARIGRILRRLADDEGSAFAPHRSLWLLDVEEVEEEAASAGTAHEA